MPNLAAAVSPEHDASLPPPPAGPLAGKRVLTIDDQAQSTRLIRLALTGALGMEVREVNDPARALAAAVQFRPDLILLDVEMPGMGGSVLWRQFRAHPDFRRVPIVFLTSTISEEETSPNRPDASTHLLAKPVSLARLTERLHTLLAPPPAARAGDHPAPQPKRARV